MVVILIGFWMWYVKLYWKGFMMGDIWVLYWYVFLYVEYWVWNFGWMEEIFWMWMFGGRMLFNVVCNGFKLLKYIVGVVKCVIWFDVWIFVVIILCFLCGSCVNVVKVFFIFYWMVIKFGCICYFVVWFMEVYKFW